MAEEPTTPPNPAAPPKPAAPAAIPATPKPAGPPAPKAPPPLPSPKKIYGDEIDQALRQRMELIDRWKELVSTATREEKYAYQRPLETVTNRWGAAFMKVDELKRAPDAKWESLKPGVEAAVKDLDEAIELARPRLP